MYQLQVFFAGDDFPQFPQHIASASVVLTAIHGMLAAHPGCEMVVVRLNGDRLFAVDCGGNTLPQARDLLPSGLEAAPLRHHRANIMKSIIERALELAHSGEYGDVAEVRRALQHEGYVGLATHLDGRSIKLQLRSLIKVASALS